ncbi:MAG: biotin synthase BioB [Pseudoflavonifractor sp.]|nr:biotin synthase BioB [Alloprevotella sp.]MCM1116683.1 biotin synthase BioB [Pseudoflavonifractor sp.]
MEIDINSIKEKILLGHDITAEEAYALAELPESKLPALWKAAAEITKAFMPRQFDTCSIVNARSGRCPEDCKWCAQSAHYTTGAEIYPLIPLDKCAEAASISRREGITRFSLVTSGRALRGKEFQKACSHISHIAAQGSLKLCASMGLLSLDELKMLKQAGITRYHCNLETSPSHFSTLCSTHTQDQKLVTIAKAREAGLEICSGGIIGMGETPRQRVELALALRNIKPVSIPINILCPIPGTPLQHMDPLTEDEIITAVAIFRLIHPKATLRFAGGRASLSREGQLRAIRAGINGAIMGDMLTTVGSTVEADRILVSDAGMTF